MSEETYLTQPFNTGALDDLYANLEAWRPKPDSMYMLVCHPSKIGRLQMEYPAPKPTENAVLAAGFGAGNYPGTTVPVDPDPLCPPDKWFVVTHQVRDEYDELRATYSPMMAVSIVAKVIPSPSRPRHLAQPYQMMTIPKPRK